MVSINIMYMIALFFNSLRFFFIFLIAFLESNTDKIANKVKIKNIRGCLYSSKQMRETSCF